MDGCEVALSGALESPKAPAEASWKRSKSHRIVKFLGIGELAELRTEMRLFGTVLRLCKENLVLLRTMAF